jgi:hypothetical protein
MWTAGSPVTANPGLHAGQTVSPLNGSQEFLQKILVADVIPTL